MQRLMCRPTYFDVEYSINPWMDPSVPVDTELAHKQWNELVDLLRDLGDTIHVMDAAPGLLDMTFSGDAGFVWGKTFVPSSFRNPERMGEVEHYERWFRDQGFEIRRMPEGIIFEGLGDLVFEGERAFLGYGVRTDEAALEHLLDIIPNLEILGRLEIVDDHYFHLAMALGFIDEDTVVYYPPAFTPESVATIKATIENPIAMGDVDTNTYFACNLLVIGRKVILDGCTPQLRDDLAALGYEAVTCDMSEFKKSGGSLRCLVLTFLEPGGSST